MLHIPHSLTVWICAVFIGAISLYAAAALRAALSPAPLWYRSAPLILLLAALLPINAYDLLLLFLTESIAINVGTTRARRTRRRPHIASFQEARDHAHSSKGGISSRFSLRDIFLALLFFALTLAIVRQLDRDPRSPAGDPWLRGAAITGLGCTLGLLAVAAHWLASGRAAVQWRLTAFVLIVSLTAGLFTLCGVPSRRPPSWIFHSDFRPYDATLVIGYGLAIAAIAFLMERSDRSTAFGESSIGRASILWRLAWLAPCLATFVFLSNVYRGLLPVTPGLAAVPNPNGYDRLTMLAQSVRWPKTPADQWEGSQAACRAFVVDNSHSLAKAHDDLKLPSVVALEFGPSTTVDSLATTRALSSLGRALSIQARDARWEGKRQEAVRAYLDILRLAVVMSNGGLGIHHDLANSMYIRGLWGLADAVASLGPSDLAVLERELPAILESREPVSLIFVREKQWKNLSRSWVGRLDEQVTDSLFSDTPHHDAITSFRQRVDAQTQLLLAHVAVRHFRLTTGELPRTLQTLVPDYLAVVPSDPLGSGPLVYRPTMGGYLLYSVGSNGRDDGGRRADPSDGSTVGKGDLFIDSVAD